MLFSMESISAKKLPPIFKLSLLSKILPYFGYLHDWKMVLESINKKTNDIWDQNKEELKYWGRDLKLNIDLDGSFIKILIKHNIRLKAEQFKFTTNWFFELHQDTEKTLDKIKEWEIDSLILQLCSQLNEDNAIVFQKWDYKIDEIFLQRRKEIAEKIPSPKCTSSILEIKEFEDSQAQDLWKYIADNIKLKRIIVKKNENNTFEVDSITSHHFLDWDEYDILYEEVRERLVTYYSCPVRNCICKPKILWLKKEYLNELSEELIDEIWGLSLLENAHRLNVIGALKTFSEISYLSKVKRQFPKLEILFNFRSWRYDIEWDWDSQININSRLITLVTKGEERIFYIRGDDKGYVNSIVDLEFNEKENIAIINWGKISLWNVILQTNSQSEIKDQTLIDKLKEKTRLEDSQYIIVDSSEIELQIKNFKIKEYTTIAKYFKYINIKIDETESEYKEEIEEINKLPKQWYIKIEINDIQGFVNSDALNLIDQDFEQIIVESWKFKIKLIKSNSRSGEWIFTVYESLLYKAKTVDIRELRKCFQKRINNIFYLKIQSFYFIFY